MHNAQCAIASLKLSAWGHFNAQFFSMRNAQCVMHNAQFAMGIPFLGYLGWFLVGVFTYFRGLCWLARGCNFAA